MYNDERMYMGPKELCGVDWFVRMEPKPETVSRLGLSRRSIDLMKTDKYIREESEGVFYAEECTVNELYYPPMRFKVVKEKKGYRVHWIRIYDENGKLTKEFLFPGKKAATKRRRVFVDLGDTV
ncbi:MAG: hypothetical protein IJN50_02445 [Clostridia bacterium]|nr:hypothetical protein [Clostridia bacterium]